MISRLLIVLGCVALGSCSTSSEFDDGADNGHARIRNPLYSNSPFGGEETDRETDSWKAARATILKTFAFRSLEQGLVDEARNYLLQPPIPITGTVAASDGSLVPNVLLRAYVLTPDGASTRAIQVAETTSDEEGNYRLLIAPDLGDE